MHALEAGGDRVRGKGQPTGNQGKGRASCVGCHGEEIPDDELERCASRSDLAGLEAARRGRPQDLAAVLCEGLLQRRHRAVDADNRVSARTLGT
jgi:hypothetical protein